MAKEELKWQNIADDFAFRGKGGPNSALAAKAASKTAFRLPVFAPAYVWP
jgi:hypothetical protein